MALTFIDKNVLLIHKLDRAFSQKVANCDIIARYVNGSDCDIVLLIKYYMAEEPLFLNLYQTIQIGDLWQMQAKISQNKPKKEFAYALVGTAAFLAIVLLIGISAFLRPAGNHVAPEAAVEEATEEAVAEEATAEPAAEADAATTEDAAVEAAADAPADEATATAEAEADTADTEAPAEAIETQPATEEAAPAEAEATEEATETAQ